MFNIENRRYVGNKYKLMDWICEKILEECPNCKSFFDVFAGTGTVSGCMINHYDKFIINDFLFSNEIIYNAFFSADEYDLSKLETLKHQYNNLDISKLGPNYISDNFGDKFFANNDALLIGYIREDLKQKHLKNEISDKEYAILLASLLYSADRVANTCGHYDAYIKGKEIRAAFKYDLIQPLETKGKKIEIYRCDANILAGKVISDIAFIDPPYNSRQYSRFYHVLENIAKWTKPELFGVALKPKEENMSEYCRASAPKAFRDLIEKLNVKYIVVTYNNTYTSKSSSSRNKITLEQIQEILENKGETKVFKKAHKCFNAGKTELPDHKEYLFITKVMNYEE